MKRIVVFFIALVCALITFAAVTCSIADSLPYKSEQDCSYLLYQNSLYRNNEFIFTETEPGEIELPASLITIEDGAFEGIAATQIKLPDSVEEIGNNAFANIRKLRVISIPNGATVIGQGVFKGSGQVKIIGASRGNVQTWAKENGVPFIPINSTYVYHARAYVTDFSGSSEELRRLQSDGKTAEKNTHKPSGRINTDPHAARYGEIFAFHIQGRAPPMG